MVSGVLSQSRSAIFYVQTQFVHKPTNSSCLIDCLNHSSWALYVPLFGTLVNLGLLFWKRHSHPWNFVLLSTFTLLEAFSLGVVTAFYDNVIVMQALLITLGVFLGLTLFTLQSKVRIIN